MSGVVPLIDQFPHVLYRVFDQIEHAQQPLLGRLRLMPIGFYSQIEDVSRRDEEEGHARLQVPGVNDVWVDYSGSFFSPTYNVCFRGPKAELDRSPPQNRFAVKISAPNQLARDIAASLRASRFADRFPLWVRCLKVRYTKGARSVNTPDREERLRLMWAQKPQRFAHEREYRLVVALSGPITGSPTELALDLGRHLTYIDRLYTDAA
jgi:hypothetical protein